jgi:two-component system, OmpR family, sensor kinase
MIVKSIRWRLQIWYGLILVLVLTGLGFAAYRLERTKQLERIDADLQQRVLALSRSLPSPGGRDPGGFGGPRDGGPRDRREPGRPEFDGPPDEGPGGGPPDRPRPGARPPPHLRLTPQHSALFENGESNAFYYVMWLRTGEMVSHSASAPSDTPLPGRSETESGPPIRTRGVYREAYHFTPPGECLLAGRSMAADFAELRRFAWGLTAVGVSVLVLGLAGGGWIATRAIRPIEHISATAVKIAAGELSQRIDIADTDTELGRLAGVLNSTFTRLEAAFSQQGRFTSDAAHELRTPVSVILTQAQTALARERTASEFRKTVEACERAAQRMRRLIESLLELARLDAGQEPMKRIRFDLSRIVRECVDLVQPIADERGVKIHCDLRGLECDGDPDRIAQVITNLLTNAIQYNKEQGEVRLSAQIQNGTAVLTVADTGHGISADDLPHVFDRFYRADQARTSLSGRTGLGLAISKAIVAAHGGNIEVTSQPGAGTTFTVRLPRESGG